MMNGKNLYILRNTEDFVRGELDNVALDQNAMSLEQMGGRYVLYGCYTSPTVSFPAFSSIAVSWNAETPKGTVVEAQCRVLVGEEWTGWHSFGKWSPYLSRNSQSGGQEKPTWLDNGILRVAGGRAVGAQLRIYLYTDNDEVSPVVRLLSASVRPSDWRPEPAEPYGRLLRLPAYSQKVRDPALSEDMDNACALTSLLNRQGQDILPEELALVMYDHGSASRKNHSFAAAAAGAYGYEAYLAYLEPAAVWERVKAGESLAMEVSYAAPKNPEPTADPAQPAGESAADPAEQLPVEPSLEQFSEYPELPGCFEGAEHQLLPLRGFALDAEGHVTALVNDSHAPTDREAEASYDAERLWEAYSGLCLLVTGFHKSGQRRSPMRFHMGLRAMTQLGSYMFQDPEGMDVPLPEDFGGCLAATLRDGSAWATTAHKHFCYLTQGTGGSVQLPENLLAPGSRVTVYAIWPSGNGLVGEITL